MPGRNGEIHILEDRAVRPIGKVNLLKPDFRVIHNQISGIGCILNRRFIPKQFE